VHEVEYLRVCDDVCVINEKKSVLAPPCSRALLQNLQPTSDRCLIFASYLTIE